MDAGAEMGIELAEEEGDQIDKCRDTHHIDDREISRIAPDVEEEVRSINDMQSAEQENHNGIKHRCNQRNECDGEFKSLGRSQEDEVSHHQQRYNDMAEKHST